MQVILLIETFGIKGFTRLQMKNYKRFWKLIFKVLYDYPKQLFHLCLKKIQTKMGVEV